MQNLPESNGLKTVRDWMRWSLSQYEQSNVCLGHGFESAWDEVVHLVLSSLHLPLDMDQSLWLDTRLTAPEKARLCEQLQERLIKRKPLPYILNQSWFAHLPFYIDQRVLIPRSPMGELIQQQFSPWVEPDQIHSICDMCTGSGCIAIACAYAFEDAQVVGADLSQEALAVAKRNVEEHGLEDRVKPVQSDLFAALEGQRFDLIIANPPYVSREEMGELPEEYRHEPAMALEAEDEGLVLALSIMDQAKKHLNPGGVLFVEVGYSEPQMAKRIAHLPVTWLEFESGGSGVFVINEAQLNEVLEVN